MKAAILHKPGELEIAGIPTPRPNDYQTLARMEACGVCSGTDTHICEGTMPFPIDYPSVFGHEGVGTVVETGRRVCRYKFGDRVLRPCAIYPGQWVNGLGSSWGSYAEYGLVTDLDRWREEQTNPGIKRNTCRIIIEAGGACKNRVGWNGERARTKSIAVFVRRDY
ncbi:MAG: alcohol dehydrogenase catalytic domain-containing protein [Verrucomicrobia bacterium]|nr:alcohol dehydrogenase catalytic domain-containing protein [Verrucomicrobiota bacterium]